MHEVGALPGLDLNLINPCSSRLAEASPDAILAMEDVLAKAVAAGSRLFKGVVQSTRCSRLSERRLASLPAFSDACGVTFDGARATLRGSVAGAVRESRLVRNGDGGKNCGEFGRFLL